MTFQVRNFAPDAYLVATCRDMYVGGGFLQRDRGKLKSWPWLHMHVRVGDLVGAVWADALKQNFLLVQLDHECNGLRPVAQMDSVELNAFKNKDGVFYTLA